MPLAMTRIRRHLIVFIVALLLFASCAIATSLLSARWQVDNLLSSRIMPGIVDASRYSLMDEDTVSTIANRVNNELLSLSLQSWLGTLTDCQLQLQSIEHTTVQPTLPPQGIVQHLQVSQPTGQQGNLSATFTLGCPIAAGPVAAMSLAFSLFLTTLIAVIPRAYTPQQRHLLETLRDAGMAWPQTRGILQQFQKNDPASLQWYDFLIQRLRSGSLSVEQLLKSANAKDQIVFHHDRQSVSIRGIEVPLSRTPYFYYALYAQQRIDDAQRNFSASNDDGWILNPAAGRANPEHSRALLTLMKEHGGHLKAIKELETHGVRAKTMDQNRNKVKEELQKVLGESVAERYLFETQRDSRTGRNHYRLKTSAANIILPDQ